MMRVLLLALTFALGSPATAVWAQPPLMRSAQSGPWSNPATWEGGKVPGSGSRVQVREGHRVVYDIVSDQAIRLLHVAGTLTFAPDRDTRLDVGLLKIQAGDQASEDGFDCDGHVPEVKGEEARPALEVGRRSLGARARGQAVARRSLGPARRLLRLARRRLDRHRDA